MSRDGFDRMDISTSIDDDARIRRIARRHPELLASCFMAYVGLLGRSWRDAKRLTLEEGWPSLLQFNPEAVEALAEAGLIDDETRIPERAWNAWYGAAADRRTAGRERQRRYNERQRGSVVPTVS